MWLLDQKMESVTELSVDHLWVHVLRAVFNWVSQNQNQSNHIRTIAKNRNKSVNQSKLTCSLMWGVGTCLQAHVTIGFGITLPDRSNLTENALLERKWNAKWNAAGTPKERQISVELERVPNKNAFYWERDNAFHWKRDNASHWELMARVETAMLQHANKFRISSFAYSWHVAGQINYF